MEAIGCPLCPDATSARPYHEERGSSAVRCDGCGLVYVTPRPTEQEMKRLYEGQDTHIDVTAQIRKRHQKLAEARAALAVLRPHARSGRLLEIGIGAGYSLLEAKAQGFDAEGLDINAHFVRFARGALGLRVTEGTLSTAPMPKGAFDVVFHRNVLSHLAYPVTEVARMRELLRPSGVMLFETGNVAELPGESFRGTEALALPDHLFHFSEPTLRALLDRTGFDCVEVRRRAVLGYLPPLWSARRALAARRARGERLDVQPSALRELVLPEAAPPLRRGKSLAAGALRAIEDSLGEALAAPGRRCSLVVVARRREGSA